MHGPSRGSHGAATRKPGAALVQEVTSASPTKSAGTVIGKGGTNMKHICETTGKREKEGTDAKHAVKSTFLQRMETDFHWHEYASKVFAGARCDEHTLGSGRGGHGGQVRGMDATLRLEGLTLR